MEPVDFRRTGHGDRGFLCDQPYTEEDYMRDRTEYKAYKRG